MSWYLNLSIRSKLVMTVGAVLIMQLLTVLVAYRVVTENSAHVVEFYDETFERAIKIKDMRSNQHAIRSGVLEILMLGNADIDPQVLADIARRDAETQSDLAALIASSGADAEFLSRLRAFEQMQNKYTATRNRQLELVRAGRTNEARTIAINEQKDRLSPMNSIHELLALTDARARRTVDESRASSVTSSTLFVILSISALVLGVFAVLLLSRIISDGLRKVVEGAELVSSGDLRIVNAGVGAERGDEVGRLRTAFHGMVGSLATLVSESRETASSLTAATSQIMSSIRELASSAAQTSSSLSEAAVTVSEVRQGSEMVGTKARSVADSASHTRDVAGNGLDATQDVVAEMDRIGMQMGSIAESVAKLSEQSQAIGEIITTAGDIAEQSNLLAVNAAIEAAKAGEHGRGFAVVAQEVRALAEQSREATARVRTILTDIQKSMSAAVMLTEQGTRAVASGRTRSVEAGKSIEELKHSVEVSFDAATQIAAATQQQIAGMDQIEQVMQSIKDASEQNASAASHVEAAAGDVDGLGQRVLATLGRFQL